MEKGIRKYWFTLTLKSIEGIIIMGAHIIIWHVVLGCVAILGAAIIMIRRRNIKKML